jgi:hypothetical protein
MKLAQATQNTVPEIASTPEMRGKSLFSLARPTYKSHVLFELRVG